MPHSPYRRRLLLATAAILGGVSPRAGAAEPLRTDWPRRRATPPSPLWSLDGTPRPTTPEPGHAVLLNFWASWCDSCVAEMPSLVRAAEHYASRGLRVVAANYRESAATAQRFVDDHGLALDVALDRDGRAAKAFDVHAFPSTVAFDRAGRARFVVMGECDWTDARSRGWLDDLVGRAG